MDKDIMGEGLGNNKLKISVYFIVIISLLVFSALEAAASGKERELFDKGYEYCISNNSEKAVETFKLFLKEFPESSSRDAAMYWLGKSLLQMKLMEEAKGVFSDLKKQYPESPFTPHIEEDLKALAARNNISKNNPAADTATKANADLKAKLAAAESASAQAATEREKLKTQFTRDKLKADSKIAELQKLADNTAKLNADLKAKLAAAESASAQAATEREKLKTQFTRDKLKADSKIAELQKLADNTAKLNADLKAKLAAAESASIKAATEHGKSQTQLYEEKQKTDAKITELQGLTDNTAKINVDLKARLAATESALAQATTECGKPQIKICEEKQTSDAKITEAQSLTDNTVITNPDLQAQIAETSLKPEAAEAALAQAAANREKLQAQFDKEKQASDARITEAQGLTDNTAKANVDLKARLAAAEAALAQATTECGKPQIKICEEKQTSDAKITEAQSLTDNTVITNPDLQAQIAETSLKPEAAEAALAQAAANREKLQAQFDKEKQASDARITEAQGLTDNTAKANVDLKARLAAAEAALAQAVANREKLQSQLTREKLKSDARAAELQKLQAKVAEEKKRLKKAKKK